MARLFSSAAVLLLTAALTGLVSAEYTPRLRTAQFTGRHMQEQCVPSLEWTSEGGEILVNGQPFHLKGTCAIVCCALREWPDRSIDRLTDRWTDGLIDNRLIDRPTSLSLASNTLLIVSSSIPHTYIHTTTDRMHEHRRNEL